MLGAIAAKLGGLVASNWASEMQMRGELVRLYREYYNGEHRMKLSPEMKRMLMINDARLDQYNANYCEMVIDSMADRLTVDTVEATGAEGGTDEVNPAQDWVDAVLRDNRFDGLQIDIRTAMLRDGETFVMVAYDAAKQQTMLAHEPAWDGECGTLVIYDQRWQNVLAGVKVFWEGDFRRVNIYYPNRTEKLKWEEVTVKDPQTGQDKKEFQLLQYAEPEDTTRDDQAPGVPIIHFPNKGKRKCKSELVNVIPLQDSLNSTLQSMVMTALLTGWPFLFARGWRPPNDVTPGMIMDAGIYDQNGNPMIPHSDDEARAMATMLAQFDLKRIEPGGLEQLINQANWLIHQIGTISSTPVPSMMGGDAQSGEALKQRDTRLLGKLQRAQVQMGNALEDTLFLAHGQQMVFATTQPPTIEGYATRWKGAEIRNDAEIRELAKLLSDMGFAREALRTLSQTSVIEFSEDDITRMIDEKTADGARALEQMMSTRPDFGGFTA